LSRTGGTDLGRSDQIIQRHPVCLRQQQQLKAGAALPVLETRQGALRDPGALVGTIRPASGSFHVDLRRPLFGPLTASP
jgi:hypothetical protein